MEQLIWLYFVENVVTNSTFLTEIYPLNMSRIMRKPDFCICKNKGADQLCGNCTAGQRLSCCYIDGTIPLLPKSEISSLVAVCDGPGRKP